MREGTDCMSRVYYAHSSNQLDKSDWQLLSNHLERVACIASENAGYFDAITLTTNALLGAAGINNRVEINQDG